MGLLLDRYLEEGYLRLEGVFEPERIERARTLVAPLPDWIRAQCLDPNIQRAQPLQSFGAILDPKWIREFYRCDRLDEVLDELFGSAILPPPRLSRDIQITGLLIEPRFRWWSTGLHRDYRDFVTGLDEDAWWEKTGDLRLFNQLNLPLLPDRNLWVVPGSHRRPDESVEAELVARRSRYAGARERDLPEGETRALRSELEQALRSVSAVRVEAAPGDLVIYRSNMLHCGTYEPGTPRLTLHDAVYSDAWRAFVLETLPGGRLIRAPAAERPPPAEDPPAA